MLNKREKAVMTAIYDRARDKGMAVFTAEELHGDIPLKFEVALDEIKGILKTIEVEDYIELTMAKRDNKACFLVQLKQKGLGFERAKSAKKRELLLKVTITAASACLGYFIKVLMDFIFK